MSEVFCVKLLVINTKALLTTSGLLPIHFRLLRVAVLVASGLSESRHGGQAAWSEFKDCQNCAGVLRANTKVWHTDEVFHTAIFHATKLKRVLRNMKKGAGKIFTFLGRCSGDD